PYIAYIFVPLFPAINLFTVYLTNLDIDNKETYLISSFVTLVGNSKNNRIGHHKAERKISNQRIYRKSLGRKTGEYRLRIYVA
ncbi:MAG: hypothetical protein ACK5LJ_17940, partial [Paracoccus sp. (in: a-proteobacteria)]